MQNKTNTAADKPKAAVQMDASAAPAAESTSDIGKVVQKGTASDALNPSKIEQIKQKAVSPKEALDNSSPFADESYSEIDKIRVLFGLEPKYTAGKARALEALSKTDSTVKVTDGKVERSHASFKNDTLPKALNVKDLYAAEKLLYQALTSAEIRNSNTNSDGIRFSGETDSDTDIITVKDIDNLRSIGRKSVNDFTSEDIKKAEPFARRYFKELGVKSPFFRAWFLGIGERMTHRKLRSFLKNRLNAER